MPNNVPINPKAFAFFVVASAGKNVVGFMI